mgnify:CR=1 FL=1
MMKLYEILGLEKDATPDQIKKAYKLEAKKHHPDKGGDEETFKEIQKAYDVLRDPDKKNLYDTGAFVDLDNVENGIVDIFANVLLPEMVDNINSGSNMLDVITHYVKLEQAKLLGDNSQLNWSKESIDKILYNSHPDNKSKIAIKVLENFKDQRDNLQEKIQFNNNQIIILTEALKVATNIF